MKQLQIQSSPNVDGIRLQQVQFLAFRQLVQEDQGENVDSYIMISKKNNNNKNNNDNYNNNDNNKYIYNKKDEIGIIIIIITIKISRIIMTTHTKNSYYINNYTITHTVCL